MGFTIFLVIVAIVLMLADIFKDYYYIDKESGDILWYYDNNYDYGISKRREGKRGYVHTGPKRKRRKLDI